VTKGGDEKKARKGEKDTSIRKSPRKRKKKYCPSELEGGKNCLKLKENKMTYTPTKGTQEGEQEK